MLTPLESRRATPSFLTLPRELRDSIYEYALVSPSPLIAWAGMPLSEILKVLPAGMTRRKYFSHSLPVERLGPKLLLCNSTTSQEAALIFYSKNTFLFFRGFVWDTVVGWLESIGPRNRQYLTKLNLLMERPQKVWQLRDGSRTQLVEKNCLNHSPCYNIQENIRERVYPPHRLLSCPPDPEFEEGVVDNISPAVEKAFQILGSDGAEAGLKLTLNLILPEMMCGLVPGLDLGEDDDCSFSMDLPNVMEKCREIHTDGKGKAVEVLWKCKVFEDFFIANQEVLKRKGWEIMEMANEDRWWEIDTRYVDADDSGVFYLAGYRPRQDVLLTLRRRGIEGVIVSDGPSLWSFLYA
jgi:hypothetical protein